MDPYAQCSTVRSDPKPVISPAVSYFSKYRLLPATSSTFREFASETANG
jgi:hypothetical protein